MGTFAELYCKQHSIDTSRFEPYVLARALPLRIRLIAPILRLFKSDYFSPDLEFVRDVGRMHQAADFKWALADFRSDPANRKFLRKHLRVRASIACMRDVVETVPSFVSTGTHSKPPFDHHVD